ncbi:reverse transcriptase [Penicillium digitatum]|uniref:Reverse transcriptase n=1 Tax=Penicillium digitatum TaxID=36651 RepID=A0A7T6XHJ5_PENDI|nr:reverse transcriptase [Penicillium digitatum]
MTRLLELNEVDNVRAIVDEVITARRDDIRGPPGRDGQDAPHSTAHWKTDDVGYFTPDPTSDVHVRTLRGTMYYTNVYAFINLLKALIPLKSEEVVRANLPSCLREAAARWYSAELSDEERQDLSVRSLELGWFATLERRFKPRATEAIVKVMAPSSVYSWRDVRAGRSVTEWAQNMLRDAQAAEITGTTTVLRLVWTRLEPALQRDIREPSPATTISQFMADLDLRYGQCPNQFVIKLMWNSIPNVQRQSQQQFPRNAYQPPPNVPQIQAQRTSYVPPQQQQPQGAYQPRQQQQQQPPQGQTNLAGQLLLSDKPWNQAGYSNTGYVARQPRARPAAAYQAEPQEVAPPDESLPAFYDGQHFYDPHNDAYYVDEEYNSYAEYPEEDPQAYWQAPPFQDNEDDHDQPCYSVTEDLTPTATCLHCSAAFLSNNKLHAHLKDCASRHTAAAVDDTTVAYYVSQQDGTETDALPPDLPIIRSDRARATQPGMAYKSWRYASTVVGLIDQHKLLVACLDTGCVMTIIDADLAKSLGIPLQKCTPVPVAGIGSRHLSSAFVSFDAFFRGADNAACIRIEAHLVENLKAKLLIGMDVIGHEGFRLDFDAKTVKIPSCMGLEIPISTHAKPHHAAQRAVYAAEHVLIPPRSIVRVPARVQATLPDDRDYVFEGRHRQAAFYSHLVEANFAWVQAVNDTPDPISLRRRDRIGTLYEADMPMACAVEPIAYVMRKTTVFS